MASIPLGCPPNFPSKDIKVQSSFEELIETKKEVKAYFYWALCLRESAFESFKTSLKQVTPSIWKQASLFQPTDQGIKNQKLLCGLYKYTIFFFFLLSYSMIRKQNRHK
jgi:hypothetical protein